MPLGFIVYASSISCLQRSIWILGAPPFSSGTNTPMLSSATLISSGCIRRLRQIIDTNIILLRVANCLRDACRPVGDITLMAQVRQRYPISILSLSEFDFTYVSPATPSSPIPLTAHTKTQSTVYPIPASGTVGRRVCTGGCSHPTKSSLSRRSRARVYALYPRSCRRGCRIRTTLFRSKRLLCRERIWRKG